MAEHILGVGTKKSIREVIAIGEQHLSKIEGLPKRINASSDALTMSATRPDYAGAFVAYELRFRSVSSDTDSIRAAVSQYQDLCSLTEEDAWLVARFPVNGPALDEKRLNAAVDTVSGAVPIPEVWRITGEDFRSDRISPELIFLAMMKYKASDAHLTPGSPPVFRVDNEIKISELIGPLSAVQINALIREICADVEWREFEEQFQTSFNYHQVGLGYSRVSAFIKAGAPHCTFRFLPEIIPSFEDLHIPADIMKELSRLHHGLLLVTGMTGSGKSTTVAALVDWINSTRTLHILSIENPIEYVHRNKRSIVSQRNTGKDVLNFRDAVTGALRHDPDVIVIGEMRDPDTIRAAINAAATGHLVISTLHANTASEVVNRVISFFDPVERDLVKLQLRDSIRCVICQRLVPKVGGGRVPALEFMFNDIKPINDGIAEGHTDAIRIGMQQTVSHSFLFEAYLNRLYRDGIVTLENARDHATEVSMLDQMVMGTYSVPRLDTIKAAKAAGSH